MIRLVVSDIDGTLLPEGTDRINPEIYEMIRELKKRGITFVAASGRQYASMYHVFAPVADDIFFIVENGSIIMQGGKVLSSHLIPPELGEKLVRHLRTCRDGEIMLSASQQIYLETDGKVKQIITNGYLGKADVVPDLLPYARNSNKITIYREYEIDKLGAELQELFGQDLNVTVAGSVWVDFMDKISDKGNALRYVQGLLGIGPEETMAFGDNCNDIGMLQQAAWSYAVADAHPLLKAAAKYETLSCARNGVLGTIREKLLQD